MTTLSQVVVYLLWHYPAEHDDADAFETQLTIVELQTTLVSP